MTAPHRPATTTDEVHPYPAPVPAPEVRAELERLGELSQAIAAAAAQIDAQRRTIERLLAAAAAAPDPRPAPLAPPPTTHPALRAPIRARRRAHPAHAVEHVAAPAPRAAESATRTEVVVDSEAALATARLVALSMAASGSSRGEVARHLRSERGIRDTARVTDHVFGRSQRD